MASLIAVLSALVSSIVDLVVIFLTDVALQDPLAFVSWAVGAGLTTVTVLYFTYLALGALGAAVRDAV